ncbi:MAG: RNA polymerase factor sigma-54 [Candidatus Krumholzibacteriia bacterium]|nr:RNA polymerase factor sigma-54 [Candidatus Latescibacterota bacterium]MCB9514697.1 RNA polymerase factor sigma-54 [Candidatus Latescibacterota bacterium]
MEMKIQLKLAQRQQLVMTPRLQQALRLLQLPTLELEQELKAEVQTNPLLEFDEEDEEPDRLERETVSEPQAGNLDSWDDMFSDGFDMQYREQEELPEEFVERVPVSRQSAGENLLRQLRMMEADPQLLEMGEYIIGSLDDRGFLTIGLDEIQNVFRVSPGRAAAALRLVQSLEPPGIGARDLSECLLLQLAARGEGDSLVAQIIRDHFQELMQRKYQEIARKLKLGVDEVQDAARAIGELDPKPGLELSSDEPQYIIPDLVVEEVDGEYVIYLNDRHLPRLRIADSYKEYLGSHSKETKDYVQGKLNQAQWLIRTVEQRRATMVKVMAAIIEEQREFFDKGPQALRPLTLQQVASKIGMHESTVSRVTNNKTVQTPRGIFRLKYFFSSSLSTEDGDEVSAKAAKSRIQEIVSKEDAKRPLSDQKIADILRDEGLKIARRTVAKYREQLGVLPARLRKEF